MWQDFISPYYNSQYTCENVEFTCEEAFDKKQITSDYLIPMWHYVILNICVYM